MDNLLRHAYVEQPCATCGESYRVTLYDVLLEHRVRQEWHPQRPCSSCAVENTFLLGAIPTSALDQIDRAWSEIVETARARDISLRTDA
jgi:hypothetical protein